MPDFGNLTDGRPFWTGNFLGGAREGILFYSPSDQRWWLGMLGAASIEWSEAGRRTLSSTWKGRFTQATRDELLMYDGDRWTIASWKGGKIEWIDAGNTSEILGTPLIFEPTPFFPHLLSWTGNFTNDPEGRDSLLFYDPASADWKAGTWNGTSLVWRSAGNTGIFGNNLEPDHRFWIGRFSKSTVDEVLFHYSGDKNWWLGTWNGTELGWTNVDTDAFGDGLNDLPFFVGNFNGDLENRDGILFFYQPDGNWWLGAWEGGKLQWRNVANTGGLFGPTVTVGFLTVGPRFWTSNGKYVLGFDGAGKWYRAGVAGLALNWTEIGSSAKFGNIGDGRPIFALDMLGDGSPQVVFYYFRDGNWLHGREFLQTLGWNLVSNTGAVPQESSFFESLGSTIFDGVNAAYDAVAVVVAPAMGVIGLLELIPIVGTPIGWVVRVVTTIATLFVTWWVSVIDAILIFLGVLLPKRMRIMILVQRDSNMKPVVPGERCYVDVTAEAFIADAISYAVATYKSAANIKLLPAEERFVRILDSPSDSETLDMCSEECGWKKDLGPAGASFRKFMMTGGVAITSRLVIGLGAPVAVFAVRRFTDGNDGAGLGPLQDYVTVDFCSDDSTMAHELGHACALWHTDDTLMNPGPKGRQATLTKWQLVLMRQSPHVTFF